MDVYPFQKEALLPSGNPLEIRQHTEMLIETVQKLSLAKDLPAIMRIVRKGDIPCRYGGEEFILVIPEINLDILIKRVEALLALIRNIQAHHAGVALSQITASIGVAMYPAHGESMQDLISNADVALYRAKNTGRNKVFVYEKG